MIKDARRRGDIQIGDEVEIVLKEDQPTGKLSCGKVAAKLTKSQYHPRGIKVRLEDGRVGRVQRVVTQKEGE